ncbi:twin-arginine translocase TatA/TatE family subunit [Tunturiibacter empetritectus]|uniref:Sec-independent protein translocase protein TatB n=1 Tax=Tunturiibacter lichenicola TaxID=2051959 RepID=A0A852VG93_9BACT|nr:twin-arginine translocase TatA/TatE family subunit [Edaphobacter lichenicola]NYF90637.1 sec-independent protein translocase protein TatB [Edaphobacter lichenicola]
MPSFQDSAVIFFLALLLFGPKKLPELARQLGKLMAEFRRASNEFRMQMEDELRVADQEEQRKKIAAMEAAAPVSPVIVTPAITAPVIADGENTIAPPALTEASTSDVTPERIAQLTQELVEDNPHMPPAIPAPLPIATSGDLNLMPPSTGLPVSNSALSPVLDAIPHTQEPEPAAEVVTSEATHHG